MKLKERHHCRMKAKQGKTEYNKGVQATRSNPVCRVHFYLSRKDPFKKAFQEDKKGSSTQTSKGLTGEAEEEYTETC